MPDDINGLDLTDAGLKAIMGNRFQDVTQPVKAISKKETPTICKEANMAQKPKHVPVEAQWEPVRPEPNWYDKLKACAIWALGFASLSCLVFYWQQKGLMDASIAVPTMCVLTALAGWGVGKNAR